jgi:acyl carrier protein
MKALYLELKQLIIESLDLEDISPDDIGDDVPLFADGGLGLDSIDALELGVALRKKYHLQLVKGDSQAREHFQSIRTLADYINSQNIVSKIPEDRS